MAYSIYTAYGDGVTNQFTISFGLGYIDKADVKCRVNKEVDGLGQPSYRPLTWITDSLIQVGGTVPANGNLVEFIRTVSKTSLVHDYSDGVEIQEKNLDDSNKQILMAVQEVLDGRFESGLATDLDFANHKAINVATGINPNDAVNLTQLEDMTGNAPEYAAAAAASASTATTQAGLATTAKNAAEAANAAAQAAIATIPLDKLNGTIAPTINDDSGDGYIVGSKWYDLVHDEAYICLDSTVGAAVWAKATLTLDELSPLFATSAQGAKADVAAPTGMIGMFGRKTAPSGWVRLNGGTIGSASSGATERANADTQTLFTLLWGEYANTELAIQDSTGAASVRGASASADFAANKRLPLEDWATNSAFPRAWDGSRTFGTYQADAMQGHRHTISTGANSSMTSGFMQGNNGISSPSSGDPVTDGTNGTPRTANETRPKNRTALFCIKL